MKYLANIIGALMEPVVIFMFILVVTYRSEGTFWGLIFIGVLGFMFGYSVSGASNYLKKL